MALLSSSIEICKHRCGSFVTMRLCVIVVLTAYAAT
ncbi:hypothetical protein EGR_11124 [Echinococcus granulosus]|uniref:Uncharacterized protein n=1 Tax=Echinococcus granulosus TaxID=6210 RepID=W6UKK5_ECHGR|nr:hypothetical protein EGR_11124 [Echinococcus granulosus]EUB54019.1 hypothetical protein EGR_11124 [Echinococcus granulosus]